MDCLCRQRPSARICTSLRRGRSSGRSSPSGCHRKGGTERRTHSRGCRHRCLRRHPCLSPPPRAPRPPGDALHAVLPPARAAPPRARRAARQQERRSSDRRLRMPTHAAPHATRRGPTRWRRGRSRRDFFARLAARVAEEHGRLGLFLLRRVVDGPVAAAAHRHMDAIDFDGGGLHLASLGMEQISARGAIFARADTGRPFAIVHGAGKTVLFYKTDHFTKTGSGQT